MGLSLATGGPERPLAEVVGHLARRGAFGRIADVMTPLISPGEARSVAWTIRAQKASLHALALALITACAPDEQAADWTERPPNVLLISIDTLRADHLGTYGYGRNTSPRIDEFAEQAQVFENASAASSWTLPGLATILTGEHSSTHGCWTFSSSLVGTIQTLPERLLARGYDTASYTANIFTGQGYGLQQGIILAGDEYLSADETKLGDAISSPRITDGGIEYIATKGRARTEAEDPWPWFLWLHYFDPHDTYLFHEGISEEFVTPDADERQRLQDLYDGEIRFTDAHIGRVLDALELSGQADGTIVIITSDHGEEFGDHGGEFHGQTLHRELTNVPLLIRAPGFGAGRVTGQVQGVDVVPTVLDLTGSPTAKGLPGRSLRPLFAGEFTAEPNSRATRALPSLQEVRLFPHASFDAIRFEQWTLIRDISNGGSHKLYNRNTDPGELIDCASENVKVVERLAKLLDANVRLATDRAEQFGSSGTQSLSAEQMEALRGLGYVGQE
ncbi:MAG: choline-sulfatase [Planctomycetota bacterium]|jgi:choline-sulfatase